LLGSSQNPKSKGKKKLKLIRPDASTRAEHMISSNSLLRYLSDTGDSQFAISPCIALCLRSSAAKKGWEVYVSLS
jgi:hypothetical protein